MQERDSIPGLIGRSLGVLNGNPIQYSYLENSLEREAFWAIDRGDAKSWTELNMHTYTHMQLIMLLQNTPSKKFQNRKDKYKYTQSQLEISSFCL